MIQETQLSHTLECNAKPSDRRDCHSDGKRPLSKIETDGHSDQAALFRSKSNRIKQADG